MNKIEIRDVVKTYDGKKNILEGISLDVREGEFFILVGPSGCGKSTLLRIIAGLEKISSGTLMLDGKIANEMPPKDRNLSMVFQNYALYPHMTVRDNILFGLDVRKVPKAEQKQRLTEAAEMLGLTEYLNRKPRELSGGQRQRVALARSVCSHSPICLMDEPLSNLDAKLRGHMRTEIRRIQRQLGLTVIYVTHDQVEAMTMGDRHHGAARRQGTADRHAARAVQHAGKHLRGRLHRLAADEPRRGDAGRRHACAQPFARRTADRQPKSGNLPEGSHWKVGRPPRADRVRRTMLPHGFHRHVVQHGNDGQ